MALTHEVEDCLDCDALIDLHRDGSGHGRCKFCGRSDDEFAPGDPCPERDLAARKANQPATPVLDAMRKVAPDSQKIGEFLDWMSEQGIHLAKYVEEPRESPFSGKPYTTTELVPIHEGPSDLLHRYFKIDSKAEEAERRALLAWVRNPYGLEVGPRD